LIDPAGFFKSNVPSRDPCRLEAACRARLDRSRTPCLEPPPAVGQDPGMDAPSTGIDRRLGRPRSGGEPFIRVRGLHQHFGENHVLRGIDLHGRVR
jgi:hypothetical protein